MNMMASDGCRCVTPRRLFLVATMFSRATVAGFSVTGCARIGGRCQAPLLAACSSTRIRDPAVQSPLFRRPLTTLEKKIPNVSKMPSSLIPNVPPVQIKTEAPNNDTCTDTVKDAKNETILSSSSSVDNDKDHNSSHDGNGFHGAIHQVEHRASEKGGIELSRLATEEAMKILERRSGALERRAIERGAERAIERAGERALERSAEISAERALEQAAGSVAERAAERVGERAAELAKGVVHPLALTIPERVALRVGRGVLIALPALGGIFALYLLKVDKARAMTERKNGSRLTFMLFGGAAIIDMVDAVCHFAIAYGVFHHFDHHLLAQMEEVSLACAFVSTFCAVMGEVIAYRKRKKLSMAGKTT